MIDIQSLDNEISNIWWTV